MVLKKITSCIRWPVIFMRVESFSIKQITIAIFLMIGIAAIVLSLFAGGYFRKAALDAQVKSLSRVIEVATEEKLKEVRKNTFNLGMEIGNNRELQEIIKQSQEGGADQLVSILDDPFVSGFVGFSELSLQKIRLFNIDLELIAESSKGISISGGSLSEYLQQLLLQRYGVDRLKAQDSLWLEKSKPLLSTVVPIGGLHIVGYVEVVIDPVLNLSDISQITQTPVSVFSTNGRALSLTQSDVSSYLPVSYTLLTSQGDAAFRIIGYENVSHLNSEMQVTQIVTTSGFLLLTLSVLLFALWLFKIFLLQPMKNLIGSMEQMAGGQLDLEVNEKGLKEFSILATSFNTMSDQVRIRSQALHETQERLLHLLDLDDSAILFFAESDELLYCNKGAIKLFGYDRAEMFEFELSEFFTEGSVKVLQDAGLTHNFQTPLECMTYSGEVLKTEALISALTASGESGFAIVLRGAQHTSKQVGKESGTDIPLQDVERSLRRILEIASNNPGVLLGDDSAVPVKSDDKSGKDKAVLRQQVVSVMNLSLEVWEHDLNRSKLALAEESKIWPVYIDKSTPTTRTLDKYLQLDSCPKNPRCQRVIDTAEYVLKQMDQQTAGQQKLIQALNQLRDSIAGVQ